MENGQVLREEHGSFSVFFCSEKKVVVRDSEGDMITEGDGLDDCGFVGLVARSAEGTREVGAKQARIEGPVFGKPLERGV
jgi:hypothetical protein